MQIDVELALVNASVGHLTNILDTLPSGYLVEDRSELGWGLVVRVAQKLPNDFNSAIESFLEPLSSLVKIIRCHGGVLRVGIFFETFTCTIRLKSYERLVELGLSLEISIYPSSN